MKNSEFVSRVVNNLRTLNKDTHISKRFILDIGKTKAKFYLSQKLDELTLYNETSILNTITCFELKSVDIVKCNIVEFRNCNQLMKSVEKLPEFLSGKIGPAIISVNNLDNSVSYKFKNLNTINRNKLRKNSNKIKTNYYYIIDGYIYLPDSENEALNIQLIGLDLYDIESACGCGNSNCDSAWEKEFVCPDRFLDRVLQETLQETATIYRTSVVDENPNLTEHQKDQTHK